MTPEPFTDALLDFLAASPTPFHATANLASRLTQAGYERLEEHDSWALEADGRYFVVRNDSSLIAFRNATDLPTRGLRMIGAHTDSPCLKVKPNPELADHGYMRLGVEIYGGVLLNPWYDRDLSLAGRVHYRRRDGALARTLVDLREALATVPSLAIHLDREANQSRSINPQTDIPPLLMHTEANTEVDLRTFLARHIEAAAGEPVDQVLDFELAFYDCQPPGRVGLQRDFLASARLDNLVSCFAGVMALTEGTGATPALLVCNDHEEVGSASAAGAQGPFLRSVLERLAPGPEAYARLVARSMLISADNAHALHPNYPSKHDGHHGPKLNGGPVIKVNANQRYASNSGTQALFRHLCHELDIPVQSFVTRADMACGSTIGPLTATETGVPTLDIGIPQLAMHSIRELCGARDPERLARVLTHFAAQASLPPLA